MLFMEGSTSGLRAGARTESGGRQARPRITVTIRQPMRTMALRAQADSVGGGTGTCVTRVWGRLWWEDGRGRGRSGMFEAADIREWRGHDVVDIEGHKIGTLESIYVDTATDLPVFATVTVGLPTRHRLVFVPLAGASVGPGYLKV